MIGSFLAFVLAPLALQAEATPNSGATSSQSINSLADLPIEEATGARCGIAFAIVLEWQASGDPRGAPFASLDNEKGREFFVRAMVPIIDKYGLEREDVTRIVQAEYQSHLADDGQAVEAMMPACSALLSVSSPG